MKSVKRWPLSRELALFAALLALLAHPTNPVAAQAPPNLLTSTVMESIARFEKKTGIAIDPVVAAELVQSAGLFVGTFCPGGTEIPAPCAETVYTPDVLDSELHSLLTEAEKTPPKLLTLAARFARLRDTTIERAGWPEYVDNRIAVVRWHNYPENAQLEMDSGSARVSMGTPVATLVAPGPHSFALTDRNGKVLHTAQVNSKNLGQDLVDWRNEASEKAGGSRLAWIEPLKDRLCNTENPDLNMREGPLAGFNNGRSLLDASEEERLSHIVDFLRTPLLQVVIKDDTGSCRAECRYTIGRAFARAITTWRSMCLRCDPKAMSLIEIDSNWWIDSRVAQRFRDGANVDLDDYAGTRDQRYGGSTSRPDALYQTSWQVYEPLAEVEELRTRICKSQPADHWASFVADEFCGRSEPRAFTLHLLPAGETCDGREQTFACADPGGGVRVVTDLVTLTLSPGQPGLGIGELTLPVEDLALHEVAHWFGVPHTDVAKQVAALDILSSVYDEDRLCISVASRAMLNNAADDRWQYRLEQCDGWRLPAVERRSFTR